MTDIIQIEFESIAKETTIDWFVNGPSYPDGCVVHVGLNGGMMLVASSVLNFIFANHDEAKYFSSDLARYLTHYYKDKS